MRGAIDFETIETQMFFDDDGKIERIVPTQRNDAHRVIEECMLAANVCASDFLSSQNHPALYRVHEGPTAEKLTALHEFLREFGLHLSGGETPQRQRLCPSAGESEKASGCAIVADRHAAFLAAGRLQSQRMSAISVWPMSLMRTLPRRSGAIRICLIHRSIKAVLAGSAYQPGNWSEIGVHCSETERRADDATRDVEAWLKCYYMRDRIGESFSCTVSGVANFGVFVALDQVYVEGLVHISELGADYFHFDAAKHQLLGERTGRRFRLGDRLAVKLVRVDLETSKIDFVLNEGKKESRP